LLRKILREEEPGERRDKRSLCCDYLFCPDMSIADSPAAMESMFDASREFSLRRREQKTGRTKRAACFLG